jgi:hypothetical protein
MILRATFLLLALLALPVQAEVFKCRGSDGRTVYSNTGCPGTSSPVEVRADDKVSAASREQAERDVARLQSLVEKREAEQRAEDKLEEEAARNARQHAAQQRVYQADNMDDCLHELAQFSLEGSRRAELEAICRAKARTAPSVIAVPVPVYGGNNPVSHCVENVLRLKLSPAEQNRRIAQCQGIYSPPALDIRPHPMPQPMPRTDLKPARPCPPNDKFCVR